MARRISHSSNSEKPASADLENANPCRVDQQTGVFNLVPVKSNSSLLHKPPKFAPAGDKSGAHEKVRKVRGHLQSDLRHVSGKFALLENGAEILFGFHCGLRVVENLHDFPGQAHLKVAGMDLPSLEVGEVLKDLLR